MSSFSSKNIPDEGALYTDLWVSLEHCILTELHSRRIWD